MKPWKFRALAYWQSWNIHNLDIFKVWHIFRNLKSYRYFSKELCLRSLAGFWICPSLNKYSLNCRKPHPLCCMRHTQNLVSYHEFRHIQAYLCPIQTSSVILLHIQNPCNSNTFRPLPYSESWHVWNTRYIQNSVKAYSSILRMLCNSCILITLPYLELCHIQAYSIMIVKLILAYFFSEHSQK